jgi:hypothetical protein
VLKFCATHGPWQPPPARCPDCRREQDRQRAQVPNAVGWPGAPRNRALQAKFRRQVLAAAGHQCQAIENGTRCPVTEPLVAHHLIRGSWDPQDGAALCPHHHRTIDRHAL